MSKQLDDMRKLQSRLRNVCNGNSNVNGVRAAMSGAVKIGVDTDVSAPETVDLVAAVEPAQRQVAKRSERGKQKALAKDIDVSVLVLTESSIAPTSGIVGNRIGRIGTATLPIAALSELNRDPGVQSIELAETLRQPDPVVHRSHLSPSPSAVFDTINAKWNRLERDRPEDPFRKLKVKGPVGENVLVGIIDVGGLDFAHEDFLDDKGVSRVIAIWDQGGDAFDPPPPRPGEPPRRGSEIRAGHIAYAMANAAKLGVRPYDLAPQSQQVIGSHATHVASIAAGRSGVCRRARIAGVMISLPEEDWERRKSFYDTGQIVAGAQYLLDLAAEDPSIEAVVINVSLGTNGGAHDGSELVSRWLDQVLFEPGRAICVAAGNSGQENPRFDGDIGHYIGRIHTKGKVPAKGLIRDLEWIVIGNGVEDISENEMEIWYGPADEFEVSVKPPGGGWIGPVGARSMIENLMLESRTFLSIYNELSDPKNGDNKISIYLSPFMNPGKVIGVEPGIWRVRLTGKEIRDGSYHAWIERDDPGNTGISARHWRLPSFFGDNTYVDDSTVSSLACGPRVIGVANLDEMAEAINESSSQGPTRDGRTKPDIAAPGTGIVAANGFDPVRKWIEMSGTSMASPYVCGVAGLMLSIAPHLTAAQVAGIMRRKSRPLPGGGYEWHNASGFGVIDPVKCMIGVGELLTPVNDHTDKLAARRSKK